jgi:hypothetical protein
MRVWVSGIVSLILAAATALAVAPAVAASGGTLTPFVDCVSVNGTGANQVYTACRQA